MKFRGKQYKYIFWDWLWTLAYYHEHTTKLYDWVILFLSTQTEAKHFLVSWARDPGERKKQVLEAGIADYLEDVWTGKDEKRGFESGKDVKKKAYEQYIKKYGMDRSEVLVIGDSFEHEIPAAQELGLDWVHISDFLNELGLVDPK